MSAEVSPDRVRAEMRAAMAKYLSAKKTFVDVHAEYARSGRWADPDFMAKKDARVRTAMADEAFYGNEVRMFAAYLAVEQDNPAPVTAPVWPYDSSCAPEGGVYRGESV